MIKKTGLLFYAMIFSVCIFGQDSIMVEKITIDSTTNYYYYTIVEPINNANSIVITSKDFPSLEKNKFSFIYFFSGKLEEIPDFNKNNVISSIMLEQVYIWRLNKVNPNKGVKLFWLKQKTESKTAIDVFMDISYEVY